MIRSRYPSTPDPAILAAQRGAALAKTIAALGVLVCIVGAMAGAISSIGSVGQAAAAAGASSGDEQPSASAPAVRPYPHSEIRPASINDPVDPQEPTSLVG